MYRLPITETGGRVNAIKEKFERNVAAKGGADDLKVDELKDGVRRSLSASPMRSKKNSRPEASRQLSNPGKNIKRTPAFRCEKPPRTKILNSPGKESLVSIVDRNVRLFESERPESRGNPLVNEKMHGKDCKVGRLCQESRGERERGRGAENGVRTTVISRQRDISSSVARFPVEYPDTFFENGAEYTRARKRVESSGEDDSRDWRQSWRRSDENENDNRREEESDEEEEGSSSELLRAALEAPLPAGPPPKKPPRTFAHRGIRDETAGSIGRASHSERESREPRDSRRMLEKLENVLVEHRSALGPKVMTPSRRNEPGVTRSPESDSGTRGFARTPDSNPRKRPTLDCLPLSLNCASSRVQREPTVKPDFESHLPFFLVSAANSQYYRDAAATAANLTPETPDVPDGAPRRDTPVREERVYAEPFAFDKNSGTDITGYGITRAEAPDGGFSRIKLRETPEKFDRDRSSLTRNGENQRPELHYMCTTIEPSLACDEDNNNVTENHLDSFKNRRRSVITPNPSFRMDNEEEKIMPDRCADVGVEQSLNRAFGKFAMEGGESPNDSNASSDTDSLGSSSASMSDEISSFGDKLRLFKSWENSKRRTSRDEVHRSLTEKRKNYVRRVSLKYSERPDEFRSSFDDGRLDRLFRVCLLIELNLSTREPYIKNRYPNHAKSPAWIENFCFPDATNWPRGNNSSKNQFYSLALMDEKGNRRYGYCRRVRPENGPVLPLVYCLITDHRASGFYQRVLLELESRHGLPDKRRRAFIEGLYDSRMPKPGQCLRVKTEDVDRESLSWSRTNVDDRQSNNNFISSKLMESMSGVREEERSNTPTEGQVVYPKDSDFKVIVRSSDPRLEERDMSQLFEAVSHKVLVVLFGSLLLERRVVLLSDQIGKLSACVEALQSLLFPFVWPHTFIPVLPDIPGLSEILQAPLPFVIGIFKSNSCAETRLDSLQDGIAVDLDTSKIVCEVGDEASILPSRLQKSIRSALQLVSNSTKFGDGIRNFLVSEAFLRTFVETCSHYDRHIVTQQDGKIIFQKESFVKASASKSEQYFLEWFVETTMFTAFVRDSIERMELPGNRENNEVKLFGQRVAEYRKEIEGEARTKRGCSSKKKTLGDRLKDLANFHA